MTATGMTHDLESMRRAGIGGAIFLEVNVGVPQGPVAFMSDDWKKLFVGAVADADRLGLQLALAAGPGWCGDGGPWVKDDDAMQHIVGAETSAAGPSQFDQILERPKPRTPFFGIATLPPALKIEWETYYRDVAVIAFPTPAGNARTADADEKALYFRAPFSSRPGVKPFLPDPADAPPADPRNCIALDQVVDLTGKMDSTGRLRWSVPPGNWTILRLGRTLTGQTTRPAPRAGLGFETNKFDASSLDAHFAAFVDKLLSAIPRSGHTDRGLTMLHFDSWEMSSQNWSPGFREAFRARRGYDPLPYLPAILGRIVGSPAITERFLWDLRQTAQELVVENHAMHLRDLAHQRGLTLSIEPYDLDPCADLKLGMAADLPMGEFWSTGYGYPTEYSIIEAASVGHTMGRPIIGAESFTSSGAERWHQYPGSIKAQADWAMSEGINKFVIHRYEHQPDDDRFPGMTMGPYGVHWERTQTWWDMVGPFHEYLARCSQLLRQGLPVADVLYLTPEGAPMVFRPPQSATRGLSQDRRGYNFDGCSPDVLLSRVFVKDGELILPEGNRYRLLVLPETASMTPSLLRKIQQLINDGATVLGSAPRQSPSLSGYPQCDREVQTLAAAMWGQSPASTQPAERDLGTGHLFVDPTTPKYPSLYPDYDVTARILAGMGIAPDFDSDVPLRYTHRSVDGREVYFVANPSDAAIDANCSFRAVGTPRWWDPMTGEIRDLPEFAVRGGITTVPLRFDPVGSGFVVFESDAKTAASTTQHGSNLVIHTPVAKIATPWDVHFDPAWGGPDHVVFSSLDDWSHRPEPGIRAYSGKAIYTTTFTLSPDALRDSAHFSISLGEVNAIASVRLNGADLGIAWCPPWRLNVPPGLLKPTNQIAITVANLWINRLITDSGLPPAQRLTKTNWNPFKPSDALQPSGLRGPVQLELDQP